MSKRLMRPLLSWLMLLLVVPAVMARERTRLDDGYLQMYNLNFDAADATFLDWHRDHPDDPVASASRAANLLFREFDRLGILQAQFFARDSSFRSPQAVAPDAELARRFRAALDEAEALAQDRLAGNAQDQDALFALTLVNGLRGDYASLIEHRNMASLSYTRQATEWANRLLALAPTCYDAYVAIGISSYVVGSLPAPLRWVLHIAGYAGDKQKGLQELRLAALHGRFLAPFARILLAVAYVREGDRAQARELLVGLQREFPANPLFAREIRRLNGNGN